MAPEGSPVCMASEKQKLSRELSRFKRPAPVIEFLGMAQVESITHGIQRRHVKLVRIV